MSIFRPIVMIPSYNTGPDLLLRTVKGALESGLDVLVIIDGSTDGSAEALESLSSDRLRILSKPLNSGKGDSLRQGAELVLKENYTHALAMDSDGQHPAEMIQPMLALARTHPTAVIMGQPVFGSEAPRARVHGRKLTSFWTNIETLWCGLGDTLFGMRVYPLKPFLAAFRMTSFARGFDFDPEIAVRMAWLGCRPVPVDVKVRYLGKEEGGVSHFHYLRDNCKLTLLHFRLLPEFLLLRLFTCIGHLHAWKKEA